MGGNLMVARVTTLKASSARLPALVDYYAGLADDRGGGRSAADYYLDAGEPAGRWHGAGRRALGLGEVVDGDELRALLIAEHPRSGLGLGRAFGDASARAFDVTFSAPKSVSVLWAIHPDEPARAEVAAAHDAAVQATLEWIERHGAVSRRGRAGVHQVPTRGLAVAVFRQHTSRTLDPQLHSHAIVSAKVQDESGRWLSLDARWLKLQQRAISWVYDAALRSELTARFGVEWRPVPEGAGQSDLVNVPAAVCELFSERSRQVEGKLAELIRRWVDEHEGADPTPRDIAMLERRSVLASRPAKTHPRDAAKLHADWRRRAAEVGFRRDMVESIRRPGTPGSIPGSVPGSIATLDRHRLVGTAVDRVVAESASWLAGDLARHLAALLPPIGPARELTRIVDELTDLAVARCLPLNGGTEVITDRRLTTDEVWREEERLLAWARRRALDRPHDGQDAVIAAVAGHAPLVLVVGPAGAGKTTAMAAAVSELDACARQVLGLAPSGKAADVLRCETGCPTMTLAKLLTDAAGGHELPGLGTTVILDEAGMAATDQLAHLAELSDRRAWRVVAVGDPAQLPAVGRAGMFSLWCERIGAHHLEEVRRFTHEWEATAGLQLRRGDPAAAAAYAVHHRLRTAHPALLPVNVADQHAKLTARGKTVATTTTSQATARAINCEIQRARRPSGHAAPLADGTRAHEGDRVATRRNAAFLRTTCGDAVRNRQTWLVEQVHADGSLTVTDAERGQVRLPARYVRGAVELGWAVTGYGNQGATVDVGIAVLEAGSSRAAAYVAMTRGRERNSAWIADQTGVADPADAFSAIVTKPARALAAHDLVPEGAQPLGRTRHAERGGLSR